MTNKMLIYFIHLYFILNIKMSDGVEAQKLTDSIISGKELKVSIGELPGGTTIFWNTNGTATGYGGYFYEELCWLSLSLNFSIEMLPNKGANFGTEINGSWSGMSGELQRKEIDIACTAFAGVVGYDIMDLAIYISATGYGILAQYPLPRTSNFSHVITFSPYIWIGLLLAIIACIGCIYLLPVTHKKIILDQTPSGGAGLTSLSDICVYIFATLTNHGGYYRNGGYRSIGIVAFAWCLATFFFVNIYSSCLTSYMSLIFQRPDINSFSDLAANPNYKVAVVVGSLPEIIFTDAESGIMKNIGDKLRSCTASGGGCSLNSFDQIVKKVIEGNFVAILTPRMGENYMLKTLSNGECHLTMAQEKTAYKHYFMGLQKNSPFSGELNKESLWWHAFGFENYWTKKALPSAPQCRLNYNSRGESVSIVEHARLKLKQFYVAFAVLFAGYILALIQFLRERIIYSR